MFEFSPLIPTETIKKHTQLVKENRITLTTGNEMYSYFIQNTNFENNSFFKKIQMEQFITPKAEKLWSEVKTDIITTVNQINYTTYPLSKEIAGFAIDGIINCTLLNENIKNMFFNELFPEITNLAKKSELAAEVYKFVNYCLSISQDYFFCNINLTNQMDFVIVANNLPIPKNGKLYAYYTSLLPKTEKALSIFTYLMSNFEDDLTYNAFPNIFDLFADDDEGNTLSIKPIQ